MLEPRANPLLLGHAAAVKAFHSATVTSRLHHGWLLAGPPGIGKATLAFRFAKWLLAGGTYSDLSVPENSPSSRRVAAGTHPDLFTVERRINTKTDKLQSEIVIATIQEAGKFMRLTPAEGGWRVVIIDGAEDLNPNAANALLKILEEPPQRAILLLTTTAPGRLLPTIRSRCRMLPMEPLDDNDVIELLHTYLPDLAPADRARLVIMAEGSIGNALALAAENGLVLAAMADEAIMTPISAARAQSIAEAVTRASDGTDKFAAFMAILRRSLALDLRRAARNSMPYVDEKFAAWQEFGKLERDVIDLNLDKRAAVIVALSTLNAHESRNMMTRP